MEEGLQALDPLGITLDAEEDLRRGCALGVEEVEAYVLGFAFLVVLHVERPFLVVLDEGLLIAHILDGFVGQLLK